MAAAVESSERDHHHPPWLDGVELLRDATDNKCLLSTGLVGLDSFLHGGLRVGQLTELVGQSSSGKTQFCLRFAASVAKINRRSSVVYIDTGNSFSSRRIEQFVRDERTDIVQRAMSRILCHSVFDIFSLFDTLHQFELKLRSQESKEEEEDCMATRLLIIDSISSLITPILGGTSSQGRALMTSLGFLLKKLAHEHNIAVLVTNHMVGAGEGGSLKPALGESWKSIPHVRLMLSRSHGSNSCKFSTLKHPSMASGRSASFTIE
ncbi:DNA repair protein RAD51 homolog 4 [Linum grandiflorum]